jgi:hypothetical protein
MVAAVSDGAGEVEGLRGGPFPAVSQSVLDAEDEAMAAELAARYA